MKLTMAKISIVLVVACGLQMSAFAQENSPYSRYGLGDLTPNHNVFTRGMAGISAAVADNRTVTDNKSINFTNPASLANLYTTIFDVGTEIDYRILKSTSPAKKFTSANTYVSYLQLGFPLTTPKMAKKDMFWGMSIGLKPVSKINYKIEKNERLNGIDSLKTLYEGSGGANQAFLGTGFRIKNFSIGVNVGYMFGSKDHSTQLTFINDSVFYYMSNSATKTSFGGLFFNAGMQYDIALKKDDKGNSLKTLRVGAYGNMQQNLSASSDITRETIFFDGNGGYVRIDSVYEQNVKGKIKYPAMVGLGFAYQDAQWMYGADFEFGNWANFRYLGQTDQVQNNWTLRAGAQYYPYKIGTPGTKYFRFVKYRAGVYYGSDYIYVNKNRPEFGFTLGTGMPLTSLRKRNPYDEYVVLNTALEFGSRGN
ncbi:MAG TPA: hypothetical protein VHL77_10800, partial [Ferruginibacter sp.]|nr:hypothetical protein [Ferruginibacter sp.]